jgi:hypothetical protein
MRWVIFQNSKGEPVAVNVEQGFRCIVGGERSGAHRHPPASNSDPPDPAFTPGPKAIEIGRTRSAERGRPR